MFEFTVTTLIHAPPETVWKAMTDVEGWWQASNPEHESIEFLDGHDRIEVGARLRIREKIAGIPGEAVGEITRVDPLSCVTWEAPEAQYRFLGVRLTVDEGVTWGIEGRDGGTRVSAHVWASLPSARLGRMIEWGFTRLFRGLERDRRHALTELRYLKRWIESGVGR